MPDFTAHHLLGQEVLRRLPEEGKMAIMQAPAAFFWGLQGPDPLFYGGHRLARYGSLLHRQPPERLLRLLFLQAAHAKGQRKKLLNSYLLGFLCHYAMDSGLHPYIFCLERRLRSACPQRQWEALHGELECQLDGALYRLQKKEPVTRFRPDNYLLDPETCAAFCRLYRALLSALFGIQVRPGQIAGAFRRCLRVSRLVYTRTARIGRPALFALETAVGHPGVFSSHVKRTGELGRDILNLQHCAWQDFSQPATGHTESVPELFEAASEKALALCRLFLPAMATGLCPSLPRLPPFDAGDFRKSPEKDPVLKKA